MAAGAAAPLAARRSRAGSRLAALTRSRASLVGLVLVAGFAWLALVGPLLSGYDPNAPVLGDRLQAPSPAHLLGTDDTGRDIATRIAHGGRISLLMGVVAMALAS